MRETLLDLMIRFNEENRLDPWNENEEELDDLDDLLGSYRRGTLGSYQAGSQTSTPVAGSGRTVPGVKFVRDAPGGGWVGNYQGKEWTYSTPKPGAGGGGGVYGGGEIASSTGGGGGIASSPSGITNTPGGGAPEETADYLADYGKGLLEPGSDLSKRWMEQMREEVGKGTDAAQRAAAYQAAQTGFGAGASPELLQMQGDIGIAGREAAGDAASDYLLRAPELGIGAMGGALGSQVGMRGQDLQSKIASESNILAREGMTMGDARSERERADRLQQQEWERERYRLENEEEQRRWELANDFVQEGSTGGGAYQPPAQQNFGGFSLGAR